MKQDTFCRQCLYDECICENYIHCTECGKDECDGVHSLRKQTEKTETERIEEVVNYILSNYDILDKIFERLKEVRPIKK
jgi:hypothetical protein